MDDSERLLRDAEFWVTQYFIDCDRLSAMSPDTHERREAVFAGLAQTAIGFVDRGDPIPDELKGFVKKRLLAGAPIRQKGKKLSPNAIRDFYLASAVYFVVRKFGLSPTRNDVSSECSACDVVARAASKQGIDVSYDVVKKLRAKYRESEPEN